jgi:hypothetical protein
VFRGSTGLFRHARRRIAASRQLPLIATPQYVDVRGDQALLSLGTQGVQWLSLK